MKAEIILAIIIIIGFALNIVFNNATKNLYKAKADFLNDRMQGVTDLYLPVLDIMRQYYAEKENYPAAKKCKDLMDALVKTNEKLKKK